jgi:hypothetical protein
MQNAFLAIYAIKVYYLLVNCIPVLAFILSECHIGRLVLKFLVDLRASHF